MQWIFWCIFMNILMHFTWSKSYLSSDNVVRITTNRHELERVRTNPKHPTAHARRSLWLAVAPRQFWTFQNMCCVSRNCGDLCNEQRLFWRTRTNCNVLDNFARKPYSLQYAEISSQCGLVLHSFCPACQSYRVLIKEKKCKNCTSNV